jgi:hypothetical protein
MQRGQIYKSHGSWFLRYRETHLVGGTSVAKRMCARLLRLSKLQNLKKEARQIRQLRKDIEADISEIDLLIVSNAPLIQFPALPEVKQPFERWPQEETPAERKRRA